MFFNCEKVYGFFTILIGYYIIICNMVKYINFFDSAQVFIPITDLIIMNQYTDWYVLPILYVYCMLWISKLLSFYLVFDE